MPAGDTRGLGRSDDVAGGLLVALSSTLFGVVVVLGRSTAGSGLPVSALLAIRFGLCGLMLAAVLLAARRPLVAARGERVGLVAVGVAGYAVESSLFFAALRHGNAAPATLLFYTYPVFIAGASWAVGRGRPTRLTIASLVLGVAGAALVVVGGGQLSIRPLGVVFALSSALAYTGYIVAADRILRRTQPLTSSMWVSGSACAGLVTFALVAGDVRAPDGGDEWLSILGMGVATAAAFVTLFAGLRRLGAVRTAIVSSTEPLAAAVLAVVFLGESIGASVAAGGALIVGGAVIASLARSATEPEPPPP
jgi:drug/metabolite transporter (DMT)-like permease